MSIFFNLEVEAATKSLEALMMLPLEERIRKRKAIQSLYLVRDYNERSDENLNLLKLRVGVNLADFKEGDYLMLHREDRKSGIKCQLHEFQGDDVIIVGVYPPDMPNNLDSYYETPLVLDKANVDLREHVYSYFLYALSKENESKLLLNRKTAPVFVDKEECENELDDTCKNFKVDFLPS